MFPALSVGKQGHIGLWAKYMVTRRRYLRQGRGQLKGKFSLSALPPPIAAGEQASHPVLING